MRRSIPYNWSGWTESTGGRSRTTWQSSGKVLPAFFLSEEANPPTLGAGFIPAMTTVDKTVAILSTVHGFVSDDAQCDAFRESMRALSMVRDVAFTIHEVSMKVTSTAGTPGTLTCP